MHFSDIAFRRLSEVDTALLVARSDPRINTVYCLLPPSRTHFGALKRFGAVADGTVDYDGQMFLKFRLDTPMPVSAPAA